jgi:tetratricopeptide (TPR) repeat protein
LPDALVEAGLVAREDLAAWVGERMTDEAAELLMTRSGRFDFHEGTGPDELFDADELALGIDLPASPLLLEAARRADHWQMIRERVPSDALHYELSRQPKAAPNESKAELQARVLELLDGTRSVGEIAASFPHRRFEFYELFADLAATRSIRLCDPKDMSRRIRAMASRDPARAYELLERGLEADPRNLALLTTQALLAENAGQMERACEALKLVVHLELEKGGVNDARAALEKLKDLDEDDPFVWEKSFELALSEERVQDATADAKRLVALYRGPGLHKKARGVIERLLAAKGESFELVSELAHSAADAGDVKGAVSVLEKYGRARLDEEAYTMARHAFREILAIDPKSKSARLTLDDIENGELQRKRAKWRKLRRRAILGACVLILVPWLVYEGLARRAYLDATRDLLRQDPAAEGRTSRAIESFRSVKSAYGWSSTALYEVPRTIAELEALGAREAPPPEPR